MAAYTRGRPLTELHVADAMSATVYTVAPHETPARAEQLMAEHQVRRLPVVGETGRLEGIVSFNDLARVAARDTHRLRPAISAKELSTTLGSICKPRVCSLDAPHMRGQASRTRTEEPVVTP
jgi:CBS-domain-containing membrane protein